MANSVIFAASDLVELAKSTGETFGFQTQLFISQVISFCIVAFVLHRFAYRPILKVLEERRQRIAESLANAEQIKKELANAQAKASEIIGQAGAQADKIVDEARNAAAKVTEQETQKAVTAAQDIIAKAREANEVELARMKAELRKEVGRLVVNTSAKVTGNILTPEQQTRLAEDASRQLANN